MIATFINMAFVLLGSTLGLLFRNKISARFTAAITTVLGLCVLGIGISGMIKTENTLCVILCMVVGMILGEALNIEKRMDGLGELLRRKLVKGEGNSRFAEGFVTASVIYCVGAMAINGAMEAGMMGRYEILISKAVIDGVTSITFAAAMGIGVAFSVVPMLLYQGGLTVLFSLVGNVMPAPAVVEMSAIGGTIIVGIAINMLGLSKEKLRVGNMLPAIFLPLLYLPIANWLSQLF